ncbi:anaerobic glycerol-3-phosphate dehydrogenase subunit A [Halanaeroarchaeum sulfurireducens]|uniref:Glycerol-3-phosphate dehydrogenase n=1 Tax=Halanaeroarchaeum sulfurireducens TaxID=1604004 RepID=A0A0F7PF93_9EURY|nr:anaerobic glycerol-3-phosphate dehydrogenase subunit A [Halanaeroarchaeum sulfurireducens]ALG82387.1 anaerobic glycerol-3-phosphate dehydrogenase subunit A [Halanaeroarchaeum sulfurireducens]
MVVGGGATGTGITRDLAMRGVDVTLVERDRLAFGTSGRMHGLLHSGARYAVSDPDTARHCHDENRTLRDIAAHCVEDTGGLFVQLPEDDAEYFDRKQRACQEAGIPTAEIDADRARREEPLLSSAVERALRVPDAAIDPFGLVAANAASAADHGATIRTHTPVTDVLVEGGAVVGVAIDDESTAGRSTIRAEQVVNATGPWAGDLAAMAGVDVPMRPAKGAMMVTNVRQVDTVINRCRPRAEGDILVPHGTTAILGTTDREIEDPDAYEEESSEVTHLVEELSEMVPALAEARPLRAYWGVRPLFAPDGQEDTTADSRDFAILDHQERDGIGGFTTVVGGKLTLYRLMAERVADLIAGRLGVDAPCRTASEPLPGSDGAVDVRTVMQRFDLRSQVAHRTADRLGDRTDPVLEGSESADRRVLCECEAVTRAEVRDAIEAVGPDIEAIRNRTRAAMGTCQGTRCGHRLASEIAHVHGPEAGMDALDDLTAERWQGQRHVAEGRLGQLALAYSIHGGTYNRARNPEAFRAVEYDAFGGGDGDDT